MTSSNKNNFSRGELLFLFLTMVILPGIFMQHGFAFFEQQQKTQIIEQYTGELQKPIQELKAYRDNESFWCLTLSDAYRSSPNPASFAERVEKLSSITGEPLQYVVWKGKTKLVVSNFLSAAEKKSWKSLINNLHDARFNSNKAEKVIAEKSVQALIGQHYIGDNLQFPSSTNKPRLLITDSAGRKPLVWVDYGSRISAMVFFRPDVVNKDHRPKLLIDRYQKEGYQQIIINPGNLARLPAAHADKLKYAYLQHVKTGKESFHWQDIVITITATTSNECIACYKDIKGLSINAGKKALFISLLAIFVTIILIRSGKISIQPGNVSIITQLTLLLFISAGIPLMSLGLVAMDHLQRKREHLIKMAYQKCIEYSQDIDKRSLTEFSQVLIRAQDGTKEFIRHKTTKAPEREIVKSAFAALHPAKSEFRAVASSGQYLLSLGGYFNNGRFNKFSNSDESDPIGKPTQFSQELKVLNDLGSYYLTFINKEQIDPKRFTEIELLTEMFYQKSIAEIMHDLVMIDSSIAHLGWGNTAFPVFASTISLNKTSEHKDYFLLIPFNPRKISREYFLRQADNLVRNQFGLKIFITDGAVILPNELHIYKIPELAAMFSRLGSNPANEPQTGQFEGENYIFAGFMGQFLEQYSILALSPMAKIEEEINKERNFVLYSGITAFTILLSITLLFGHSFIFPLSQLQKGAIAVEQRNFSFQLPALSNDEFGDMGKIFNKSISELEELSIASIVQGRLMPAHVIDAGQFDIFGKSIPMADLGGDYFDYFVTDQDHFSVLLGDVAGHGVGASLIMAMAKAGIICSEKHLSEPALILGNLHQMICATRSKTQRKVMTFQYLHLNKKSGVGKYANAGGCSPILVSTNEGRATEITQSAPVLGGFKNSKFNETSITLNKGEAMVFYTDGIIEVQNPAGQELGYERFKEMLLANYSTNAQEYYNAVFAAYLQWLGSGSPQDDLTMIIVVHT